jgi:hypothetical protein
MATEHMKIREAHEHASSVLTDSIELCSDHKVKHHVEPHVYRQGKRQTTKVLATFSNFLGIIHPQLAPTQCNTYR